MTTTVSVNGRTAIKAVGGTVYSVAVTTAPHLNTFSLHDCAMPSQAGVHNQVWPINLADPGAAAFPLTTKLGIVLHEPQANQVGTYTVVFS